MWHVLLIVAPQGGHSAQTITSSIRTVSCWICLQSSTRGLEPDTSGCWPVSKHIQLGGLFSSSMSWVFFKWVYNFHHFYQCRPLCVFLENNGGTEDEGNLPLSDEPGDPEAPWPAMTKPHSSHSTYWWGSDTCNGCHMKMHLSPHLGTLPVHKIIISTKTFLSAKNHTHKHT